MTLPLLWNHQREAIERATNRFALFFDPGTGKTRTAIELHKRQHYYMGLSTDKYQMNPVSPGRTIIFAPLNVCRNWEKELALYLDVPYAVFLVAGQSKAIKKKTLQAFCESPKSWHVFLICNTECLRSKEYLSLLMQSGATFIIADEAHQFKTPNSLQTKGLISICDSVEYVYLLTGTPAPQGEMDLWSTFYLLNITKDSFYVWRKKHFMDKNERRRGMRNYWPEYTVTPKARAHFQQLLEKCSMTARKSECLDLPPLLRTVIYAEMSPAQKRNYDTMKEYLFAIDEQGEELNASNVLVRTMRMQQILAGCTQSDNPRLQALSAAIEKTNGAQFIIWTIFEDTYDDLRKLLEASGILYGELTGRTKSDLRQWYMDEFQAGRIRALIANPKAGGVGVNLTAASYSIHYTRSFSLVDDLQCEARNYRGGSERHESITRIDIVTPDTIDEEISKALAEKKTVQDFIMGLKNGNTKTETRRKVAA